jgi:F-type H+-transporting ATPase subunit a
MFRFASESESSGPVVHIAPGGIFEINGLEITNSMIYMWICSLVIIFLLTYIARRMTIKPKGGITQFVEIGSDFITGVIEASLGDRAKAVKYGPYFVAIFFFIAISNVMGLLPGVGEAIKVGDDPLFRAFTADLNGTLAIAFVSMCMIQYFAMKESGFVGHLRHYFSGKLWNPATYVIGFYEIFNEIIRLLSLALRLFLNIAVGEIIIAVFSYLGSTVAPITAFPFLILELGVAFLQAYIFVMLSVTYLSIAVKHGHDEEDEFETVAAEMKM